MRIGIPKETLLEEKRVALAPAGVDALVKAGHSVFIQTEAGLESHFTDDEYRKVGANIAYERDEIYHRAELIIKVAPLTDEEVSLMDEDQIVFSFLHLAVSKRNIIEKLIAKKVTAISYELVERNNELPVLQSMSEIAGQLAIQIGERYFCSDFSQSRGILMGGLTGVSPAAVVILGAGMVGLNAARAALGRGAHVIVLDKDLYRLRRIENYLGKKITTVVANSYTVARGAKFADLMIGAIRVKGEKSPMLVTEEMVKSMKRGAVIIDISIDQGGCFETSRPTTISDPVFVEHGVIHYCVPNMPSLVSRTASYGLTNATLGYILDIADNGINNALLNDSGLANGVCTFNGFCSNEGLAETFDLEYRRLHIFSTN
ncbi:MAG: alanine dehydrogenase [Melioribacteraceae bacterium]|nr:alanine dehydrogenase [Melioribacteraceae bacterium]MCF8355376.1 alanine dehydrogenase [Melioribacteraceae bacterium]MCF8394621.1 alanine dehydrogenase [Melioribacteraceae bacterium]MCF8419618.1 alanine dehydrogenase [Melioribacteraceae bacterium]